MKTRTSWEQKAGRQFLSFFGFQDPDADERWMWVALAAWANLCTTNVPNSRICQVKITSLLAPNRQTALALFGVLLNLHALPTPLANACS